MVNDNVTLYEFYLILKKKSYISISSHPSFPIRLPTPQRGLPFLSLSAIFLCFPLPSPLLDPCSSMNNSHKHQFTQKTKPRPSTKKNPCSELPRRVNRMVILSISAAVCKRTANTPLCLYRFCSSFLLPEESSLLRGSYHLLPTFLFLSALI